MKNFRKKDKKNINQNSFYRNLKKIWLKVVNIKTIRQIKSFQKLEKNFKKKKNKK